MPDDLEREKLGRTGWETEHVDDPPDHADAFALLDAGEIAASRCPHCVQWICTCDDDSDQLRAFRKRYAERERGERVRRWA
jgi:hypothetical protein